VHDWKSCVPQGTEGSNPSLSASFKKAKASRGIRNGARADHFPLRQFQYAFLHDFSPWEVVLSVSSSVCRRPLSIADRSDSRVPRNGRSQTPSGPGGSSGSGLSRVPRGRLAVTCVGNALSRLLKKSFHGLFQSRKPKTSFRLAHKIKGLCKPALDFGRPSLGSTGCFSTAR
jgi:hypothetical protein